MNAEIKEHVAAINSGIIPEGYKKTKVGIVPVEWDIKALGKISQFLDNQRKPVKENERSSGIYPYYGASGIIDYVDDYLFDGEYILLGEDGANIVMRSSPLAFKVKGKMWINNHAHVISPNDNCNIDFLVNILESLNYEKYNSGTAQPKLNREVCESITLPFPPLPEQQKIAEILSTQDKLIELQEKKIEQLKELKKAYLQKMFPQKGSKYPELRFKGFTEPWEQRKVGELTVESSEYTTLEAGFPLLTSSRNGLMYQNEYRGKQTTDSTETMFSIVPLGACTYRHMSDDDVFHLNVNRLEKGLVSREYPVFYASDDNNLDFIVQQINSSAEFRSFCAEQKKGGTRTRLYYKNLCEFQMLIPNTEEQEKIATFLLTLDTLITLHQRKSEQEKQKKKALMQLLLTGIVRTK